MVTQGSHGLDTARILPLPCQHPLLYCQNCHEGHCPFMLTEVPGVHAGLRRLGEGAPPGAPVPGGSLAAGTGHPAARPT